MGMPSALDFCAAMLVFQGFLLWRTSRNLQVLGALLSAILKSSNGEE